MYLHVTANVQFQKNIHTHPMEGHWKPNLLKESMELNWNFQRGGGIQTKKPSMGGVWIFSGTIQCI